MSIIQDDNRHINLSIHELERLCPVAKALASPMRVKMIELLSARAMNVNALADALSIPVSTAALNVRQLEEAGLIASEIQPGIRGAMKLCTRRVDSVSMRLVPEMPDGVSAMTIHLPIGSYSAAEGVTPGCGIVSEHAWLGENNAPRAFYHPDRLRAQLLWFRTGELEYRFSLGEIDPAQVEWLEISMEVCAASGLGDEPSDIFASINGVPLGACSVPGDMSGRRGRLNPAWWSDTATQYGQLRTWHVDGEGSSLDGRPVSLTTIEELHLDKADFVSIRVGVHASPENVGGMTLFGEKFGDFPQGIVLRAGCAKKR